MFFGWIILLKKIFMSIFLVKMSFETEFLIEVQWMAPRHAPLHDMDYKISKYEMWASTTIKIIAFGPVFMFLSLWNDTCTIFSYFEHLRVCGEARKISRNSKNRWFLELRFRRSLTASKWDMNIIFLITERYNVKFGKFTWKNMEGRMAGRYMNHELRYTPIFM